MLALWSLLFPFWTSYTTMWIQWLKLTVIVRKESLKHSLYVCQVGQNCSLFQCHECDFLSSLLQGNIEVGSPAINHWNAVYTTTILQLKLQILYNTSYWISISLESCISLTLSDPEELVCTVIGITLYHGRLWDKNLVQEAVSASHGAQYFNTSYRYPYQCGYISHI